MITWLLEPLSHDFMVRALLVSALVGGVCGLLSCYMTLKGWALMGDAVSHAVLPGVVLAYALGLPFSLGAFVFGVGSVTAIGFVKQKSRVKEDTVIGLVFTGFFALGLVLVSKTRSNIDLTHILFGNVLGISQADIQQTLLISALVVAVLLLPQQVLVRALAAVALLHLGAAHGVQRHHDRRARWNGRGSCERQSPRRSRPGVRPARRGSGSGRGSAADPAVLTRRPAGGPGWTACSPRSAATSDTNLRHFINSPLL